VKFKTTKFTPHDDIFKSTNAHKPDKLSHDSITSVLLILQQILQLLLDKRIKCDDPIEYFISPSVKNMEVEVEKEELFAVHKWNTAQLIKQKNRVLLCHTFSEWRRESLNALKTQREQEFLHQHEFAQQVRDSQPSKIIGRYNDQLRQELESLQREQHEIERMTGRIRGELNGLHTSSSPSSFFRSLH
jgi:hypothetical protein